MQLVFDILSWGAWSVDFQDKESWTHWDKSTAPSLDKKDSPALAHVPAMQRRRFSRLTKMMLSAAHDCQPAQDCRSVFSSRHGELTRTLGLLEDIVAKEALSPLAFSQSVHNTASGIYGIVTGNTAPSTSIAAGEETLSQAVIETYAQLAENPAPVLLVFGDDPVPAVYNQYTQENELPLAMGLYLAPANNGQQPAIAQLTLSPSNEQAMADNVSGQKTLSFAEFINGIACQKSLSGHISQWHWQLTAISDSVGRL
ncbi:beta-ketoacyl synthase chain length factor [Shewanella sp. 1_MG-2023]|uniref:beta-ketoacyl synthase chain length factor n=1 Tax=unclassified Shewanella TaxID=196818 RepID=UPI0026E42649|nr:MULTISPECIES: beta-ketoacyl synthase chain length factor [unclassified Shewanella]MDO6612960.1 beta-ketoacyl synthase chain length factor [Shewanella sp. 7_MG-2023]MDO6772860.1 beta-ketoacyl synthase chain length factor [Shewanella sp. 2_MG-2023]MDO6795092.1 beta-ketoacyl synthase chain length factor [Shewanella sp. 1_MG-2023]